MFVIILVWLSLYMVESVVKVDMFTQVSVLGNDWESWCVWRDTVIP